MRVLLHGASGATGLPPHWALLFLMIAVLVVFIVGGVLAVDAVLARLPAP